MDEIDRVIAGLTKGQRWFLAALSGSWTRPGEIGANPNHTANRNRRLVEASTEGANREYRLTSQGLAVRARLKAQEKKG